jgi:hypothetical protein
MHFLFLLILMTELNHSTILHLFVAKAFITAIAYGYKWELRACFDTANQPYKQQTHNGLEERRRRGFDEFFGVILDKTVSFK